MIQETVQSPQAVKNLKRVLVVEDDRFWQRVIRQNLRNAHRDIEVLFAGSGETAMTMLTGGSPFHLIISDQNLEGAITGLDLWNECNRLKKKIPFVLTSGTDFQPEGSGGPRFINKSSLSQELSVELMEQWNAGRPEIPRADELITSALSSHRLPDNSILIGFALLAIIALRWPLTGVEIPLQPETPVAAAPVSVPVVTAPAQKIVTVKPAKTLKKASDIFTPELEAQMKRVLSEGDDVMRLANEQAGKILESRR